MPVSVGLHLCVHVYSLRTSVCTFHVDTFACAVYVAVCAHTVFPEGQGQGDNLVGSPHLPHGLRQGLSCFTPAKARP